MNENYGIPTHTLRINFKDNSWVWIILSDIEQKSLGVYDKSPSGFGSLINDKNLDAKIKEVKTDKMIDSVKKYGIQKTDAVKFDKTGKLYENTMKLKEIMKTIIRK